MQKMTESFIGDDTISIQLASLAVFALSLALGFALLRLRDLVFGDGVSTAADHHIDFNKKIEEEEQLNLDLILQGRRCKSLDTDAIVQQWERGEQDREDALATGDSRAG